MYLYFGLFIVLLIILMYVKKAQTKTNAPKTIYSINKRLLNNDDLFGIDVSCMQLENGKNACTVEVAGTEQSGTDVMYAQDEAGDVSYIDNIRVNDMVPSTIDKYDQDGMIDGMQVTASVKKQGKGVPHMSATRNTLRPGK